MGKDVRVILVFGVFFPIVGGPLGKAFFKVSPILQRVCPSLFVCCYLLGNFVGIRVKMEQKFYWEV